MRLDYSKLTETQRLAIDEVMDNFDFEKVKSYMDHVGWQWGKPAKKGEWEMEVPELYDIKAELRRILVDVFTSFNNNKEDNESYIGPVYISTGGFTVYGWDEGVCQVFFSVTDWWVDAETVCVSN